MVSLFQKAMTLSVGSTSRPEGHWCHQGVAVKLGHVISTLEIQKNLNKMKPTNPNADTYDEEQRQYLFVTKIQRTHLWGTLTWHTEVTLL